ncbi:sensor histidine kinase [Spirillospora sp. NPDC047279]|uniref:sensor histidine kinase n=1 Tax=Spirillospora sp. NPDC047279 TaxID=3155478 RepID=UPI0033DF31AE
MDVSSELPEADGHPDPTARLLHQAFLYDSDQEFTDVAAAFLCEGLARGESAFVAVTSHNLGLLREAVPRSGHLGAGVHYVDSAAWYSTPGRTLTKYVRYVGEHAGASRLRVIGEPRWAGRTPLQVAAWQRYESVVNLTLSGAPATILCPYDTRRVPREVVEGARRTHPELVGRVGEGTSGSYLDPVAFSAEVDGRPLPSAREPVARRRIRPVELGEVRRFVMVEAASLGLAGERLEDLLISVQEIATNVVKHGGGHGTVSVWADGADLVCDIADRGGPWDHHAAGHLPPSSEATSGLGLWLARRLCDQVDIRTGGGGSLVRLRMGGPTPLP